MPREITSVAVVGGWLMGAGIAEEYALPPLLMQMAPTGRLGQKSG